MSNVKPPLTPAQRQLRMNIRNAYGFCSVPELLESKRHRATIGRSEFELSCFDELISEAACERNRSTGNNQISSR